MRSHGNCFYQGRRRTRVLRSRWRLTPGREAPPRTDSGLGGLWHARDALLVQSHLAGNALVGEALDES
jgi:hypothetical protein